MKSVFRATAILSSSSLISILVSLISCKVMALCLHPSGYGYYGLLQSFISVASLAMGLGISTGLVRFGAGAVAENNLVAIAALRRAAWWVLAAVASISLLLLVIVRRPISQLVLGNAGGATTIMLVGIALVFTVAATIDAGILNAYHRVGALAKYGIANTVLSMSVAITAVLIWKVNGVLPAVIGVAISNWLAAHYFLHRELGSASQHASGKDIERSAWQLLRFGTPYTASMLVGTGVQLALPVLVLHLLSTESVGYYKAAIAISVGYLGFLVTAMGQDYYPRVSAVANSPSALVSLINEQQRLVLIIGIPIILVALAVVPILVPLVYSSKFLPTIDILEWQLIGDIFKFSSWTMSFVILARCSSRVYFLTEAVAGASNLITTWWAVRWFGLMGLGISFLVTYIIYYVVVWIVVRRDIPLVWSSTNKKMLACAVAAALLIRILPSVGLVQYRSPIALALATIAAWWSIRSIWREVNTGKRFPLLDRMAQKIQLS